MKKLRIIVGGFIGLYPTGGVTWDYIQYPLGFKLLGHDVYYIEDTGQYSSYRVRDLPWDDPSDTVDYLDKTMDFFGMSGQWAYRDLFSGKCFGMSLERVLEVCASADVFINISAATIFREEYLQIPSRVLIDSDPMFTQIQTFESATTDDRFAASRIKLKDYNYHFSFGENIGAQDCRIPELGIRWRPTRQPICLSQWKGEQVPGLKKNDHGFTTIMNWSTRTPLVYDGETWGQKDVEFRKYMSVPSRFSEAEFKVILSVSSGFKKDLNQEMIRSHGWKILEPAMLIGNAIDYQNFIANSMAEFSVAKETYVKSNSGWFSCRSACYLAMGKPVITQETGWSKHVPSGCGLFSFSDVETALEALKEVSAHWESHAHAARKIAEEYFDSQKVLNNLLNAL